MRKAPILLIATVVLVLALSKHAFGRPAYMVPLPAHVHRQFDKADSDHSDSVSFDEFLQFFMSPPPPPPPPPSAFEATTSLAASSPPLPSSLAQAAFDNKFMKTVPSADTASSPPRMQPPPPPPPIPAVARRPFDNAFMRLTNDVESAGARGSNDASDPDSRFLTGVDASCHATLHAGYAGGSLGWGMTFKVATAQECCEACKAHARVCAQGESSKGQVYYRRTWEGKTTEERCPSTMSSNELGTHQAERCNVFVFCPTPTSDGGLCWSNDVWNHTYGECWLKNQADPSRPWAGAYGSYPPLYRKKHRSTPPRVQWMSGSLTDKPVVVDGPHWHW